jgi:hypothetical protein
VIYVGDVKIVIERDEGSDVHVGVECDDFDYRAILGEPDETTKL